MCAKSANAFFLCMADVLTQLTDVVQTEEPGCFDLTYSERIIGFGICAGCGLLSGILAIVSIFLLNLRKFAVLFTISTILFFVALTLLIGYKKILNSCADKSRMYASIILVCGMLFTLFFGVVKTSRILTILGFAVEFTAFLYFALSYIPGGTHLFHLIFPF